MARKLFLVIAAVLSGSVFGAWDRHLLLPGYSPLMDQPKPHDLAYFKNSHCVERGHIDHMPGCPPAKTEVKVLGFVNGVAFVRIVYEVKSDPFVDGSYREPQFLTSILAKTGPDEYHEILHQQNWPFVSYFGHAKFFTIDGTSFIYSQLDGGGNAHGFTEIILRVTADGVRMMDPKPIHDAAQRVIPTDSFGYSPASAFSFKELTWRIATEAKTNPIPKMGCCDGTAEVKFKIKDGTFIPSGAKFFPGRFESQRYWREVD